MGRINVGRVVLGGLLAGLIINIGETVLNVFVLGTQMEAVTQARNVPPVGGSAIGGFVVMCFLLGIGLVWIYAAIRPRFGPGPGTAVVAGIVVWLLSFVWATLSDTLMQFIPPGVMAIALAWSFVETVAASVAGAWVYQE